MVVSDAQLLLEHIQGLVALIKNYTLGLVGDVTEAASEALIELDQKKADKPVFIPFTLPVYAWQASDEGSVYAYYADVPADVTSADGGQVTLSPQTLAQPIDICPTGETLDGALRFWADEIPDVEISGVYEIKRTEG